MDGNPLIRNCITVGIILLFVGSYSVPSIGQESETSLPTFSGNWWYVGGSGPGNYTQIQDAINQASDGDIVFVYNGMYMGHVNINKSISLFGEDMNTTIISGFVAYTVSILSDGVTMSGFTIRNDGGRGEGVRIDSNANIFRDNRVEIPNDDVRIYGDNNSILNNIITGDTIYLSGDENTLSGNTITNDEYGILLTNSWGNLISANSFVDSGLFLFEETGWSNSVINNTVNGKPLVYLDDVSDLVFDGQAGQIFLLNCTNVTVRNQELRDTTVGIQAVGCTACVFSRNTVMENRFGICLNGWDNAIYDNVITDNHGALRLSGDSNAISDNIFSRNDGAIYLYSSDSNTICSNSITCNYDGLLLDYGSDRNTIVQNIITNNSHAILLSGDGNIISGNTIADNQGKGIFVGDSADNMVLNNLIENNSEDGIRLFGMNTTIAGNVISTNAYGIRLVEDSDWNSIFNNTFRNNTGVGLSIDAESSHNRVYHNNFIQNGKHAESEGKNIWEQGYPAGGNYWDDYGGVDRNGDGLGDTAYVIPGDGNQDGYPFLEPNGWSIEPVSKKVFLFGKMTNLTSLEGFLSVEAVKMRILSFTPLKMTKYVSGEKWIIQREYQGWIGAQYVVALCIIKIRTTSTWEAV